MVPVTVRPFAVPMPHAVSHGMVVRRDDASGAAWRDLRPVSLGGCGGGGDGNGPLLPPSGRSPRAPPKHDRPGPLRLPRSRAFA